MEVVDRHKHQQSRYKKRKDALFALVVLLCEGPLFEKAIRTDAVSVSTEADLSSVVADQPRRLPDPQRKDKAFFVKSMVGDTKHRRTRCCAVWLGWHLADLPDQMAVDIQLVCTADAIERDAKRPTILG